MGMTLRPCILGENPRQFGGFDLEAFLLSTGIVGLAEMGDKTQLLSIVLAARFKRPWPIVWGILAATLLNHGLAGAAGSWITDTIGPDVMRWILGASFLGMAIWTLIPDKLDEDDAKLPTKSMGVFVATAVAFFLAEMGDKTQFATVALGAQYDPLWAVVVGTTLGMMLANVPAVFFGEALTRRVPIKAVHRVAAGIFAALGLVVLLGWDKANF
jgi:Ca2+/H+ antiporter, TMEM165/GDT1 family